ncbi:hypothetical protein [Xylophilus rhododendri]|nr:hypothetical protein [Xylophilus rhododendri]
MFPQAEDPPGPSTDDDGKTTMPVSKDVAGLLDLAASGSTREDFIESRANAARALAEAGRKPLNDVLDLYGKLLLDKLDDLGGLERQALRRYFKDLLDRLREEGAPPARIEQLVRSFASMETAADEFARRMEALRALLLGREPAPETAVARPSVIFQPWRPGDVAGPALPTEVDTTPAPTRPATRVPGQVITPTDLARPAPAGPGSPVGRAPGVIAAQQAQALEALRVFEQQAERRLPQLGDDAQALNRFLMGQVEFADLHSLAIACPVGVSFARRLLPGGGPERHAVLYPQGPDGFHFLAEARVRGQIFMVREHPRLDVVQVSSDRGEHWITTNVHTSQAVEAAKVAMWMRLRQRARALRDGA